MGKAKGKITNWSEYNQALVNRGSITFWIDAAAIDAWHCDTHHGRRGRGFQYSDTAIETALILKGLFKLPLRALEGFINSIFELMRVPLKSPNYSCISKRAKSVDIQYRLPASGQAAHILIDATGLKVFGEGEWKVRKHGAEKRRTWRKLHLAVDAKTHQVVSAVVSVDVVTDAEALPTLLKPLRRQIRQVSADGAYDTKLCYKTIASKGAVAAIPPRKNGDYWEPGHPRNKAIAALKSGKLKQWKMDIDYHKRSLSETAMSRYKQLASGKLSLRNYNAQVGEVNANIKMLNKLCTLGMPVRKTMN